MDTDAYTCGQCKHGNFYDQCGKCEDDYERQRKAVTTRQKLGEAWAPWMDKKPEPTSKPCELERVGEDGAGRVRLTQKGQGVIDAMAWL